jgi:hypothetical protein
MMIQSALDLSAEPNKIEFCIYLDESDRHKNSEFLTENLQLFYGPPLATSTMMNFMYSQARGEIIMYASDDIIFQTKNWDVLVEKLLRRPLELPGLLAVNDLSPNTGKIATHGFVTRSMADALQYLLPPYFESEFCDTWLTEIAKKSNTFTYAENIIVEHLHPDWGKATYDDTYSYRKHKFPFRLLQFQFLLMSPMRSREIKLLNDLAFLNSGSTKPQFYS